MWIQVFRKGIQQHEMRGEKNQLLRAISWVLCPLLSTFLPSLPGDSGLDCLQHGASLLVCPHNWGRRGWSPVGRTQRAGIKVVVLHMALGQLPRLVGVTSEFPIGHAMATIGMPWLSRWKHWVGQRFDNF